MTSANAVLFVCARSDALQQYVAMCSACFAPSLRRAVVACKVALVTKRIGLVSQDVLTDLWAAADTGF